MAKTPQEQTDELMLAVGHSLRSWASVEEAVVILFSEAASTQPERLGIVIMNAIVSFEAKVKVCNQVMRFRLKDDPDLPVWDKLVARILKFYKKRHELAHFNLVTELNSEGAPPKVQFRPFGLFASLAPNARGHLSAAQIDERAEKFGELQESLSYFMWEKLLRQRFPPEAPPSPIPDLVHRLRTQVAQNSEELPQRPQSS